MTITSRSVIRFLRQQALYVFVAAVVGGIFWATGQQINFFAIIVYSLCIGNLTSLPMEALGHLYVRRPFPYNWLVFLGFLFALMIPVYAITTVIVWLVAAPAPVSLWTLLTEGWKFPLLVTLVFSVMSFLYNATKERLCDNGQIEMDNNAAERALRAVALGRKNYLFAGSDAGGKRAASIYSLIGTAKLSAL